MNPALVVTIPRSALNLDHCRFQDHLSYHAFAWQLRARLTEQFGYLVVADLIDCDHFEIRPGYPRAQAIDHQTIAQIDTAVDELLAVPQEWQHPRGWAPRWEEPDPFDPWHQVGWATWGEATVRFTIAVTREPYALLVGYRAEGDETRKWYRCRFPAEHPNAGAIGHAIWRSIGIWVDARWPEGPCRSTAHEATGGNA